MSRTADPTKLVALAKETSEKIVKQCTDFMKENPLDHIPENAEPPIPIDE